MPDLRGYAKGDQFVRVVIETPTRLTAEQEDLIRKLAETEKVKVTPHARSFFDKLKDLFAD
jgi:molecular chaperone DnaJ